MAAIRATSIGAEMYVIFIGLVVVAAFAGMAVSLKIAEKALAHNRSTEWPENEKSEPLSQQALHWTVAHIRDDLGGIYAMLMVTNGLLAGVLAAVVILVLR
jgi:hypothetical protein